MASVRDAAACIGRTGDVSVLRHLFGFRQRRVPADPADPADADWRRSSVSVLERVRRLDHQRHHHLNVLAIGWDLYDDPSSTISADEMWHRVDYAVYRSHDIFDQARVSIGRVRWVSLPTDALPDGTSYESIDTEAELDDLTQAYTAFGHDATKEGIDVFVPFDLTVSTSNGGTLLGKSIIDGPCDREDDKADRDGSVVNPLDADGASGDDGLEFARTFAHENGHYLGLEHPSDMAANPDRLMTQSGTAYRNGGSVRTSNDLTSGEGSTVRSHCSVNDPC